MRVLHLSAGNLYGGIETLLVTLARLRGLCPAMQPSYGVCFPGRLEREVSASGAFVHLLGPVRISRPWTVWTARRRLARLLAAQRFDVVVTHGCWLHALFGSTVGKRRIPLVFWAHDLQAGGSWLERWAGWTSPDLVIANSRATRSTVGRVFPRAPSEVLYLPVAAPEAKQGSPDSAAVRATVETAESAVVLVQACRLERWKGHTTLLEALGRLRDEPGWVLWIAGGAQRAAEEQYLAELRKQCEQLEIAGRVRLLGQRTDVPRLLRAADIHCQPNSGAEPFGIAFVEALHAGLPVVTTAIGGALEIVDETCGVLVPPRDPAALAGALQQLIRDPQRRASLGRGGPARARELCDPSRQITRLHQLLAGVVSASASQLRTGQQSVASAHV